MVAGFYGMNFKFMPELEWHWRYAYAIVLTLITTALTVLYFRHKKWM
jgi:magnesium transporter